MYVRSMQAADLNACAALVLGNWGEDARTRLLMQFWDSFQSPIGAKFFVAIGERGLMGFAAYQPSMLMRDYYHLIWLAVGEEFKGTGAGTYLTNVRLEEIRRLGGSMVSLVTQKVRYFNRFGFRVVDEMDHGWTLMTLKLSEVRM